VLSVLSSSFFLVSISQASSETANGVKRLVVVPDVHGDRPALEAALRLGRVPLKRSSPTEGDVTLVFLGDCPDRGPDARGCYEALESANAIRLLGNHDWLNLLGVDFKDDPATPYIREDLFARYVTDEDLKLFGGWEARKKAFSSKGDLGRSIRENFEVVALLPSAWHKRGELPPLSSAATLMVHAGIKADTALKYQRVADMAREGRQALSRSLKGDDEGLLGELLNEILQNRFLAQAKEGKVCPDLKKTLMHFGAARMVLGHTPQDTRREKIRCGGRLVLLDVAMSRWLLNPHRPEKKYHPVALEAEYQGDEGRETLSALRAIRADDTVDVPFEAAGTEL